MLIVFIGVTKGESFVVNDSSQGRRHCRLRNPRYWDKYAFFNSVFVRIGAEKGAAESKYLTYEDQNKRATDIPGSNLRKQERGSDRTEKEGLDIEPAIRYLLGRLLVSPNLEACITKGETGDEFSIGECW